MTVVPAAVVRDDQSGRERRREKTQPGVGLVVVAREPRFYVEYLFHELFG